MVRQGNQGGIPVLDVERLLQDEPRALGLLVHGADGVQARHEVPSRAIQSRHLFAPDLDPGVVDLQRPQGTQEVLDGVLQTVCDRGCTILFSSHTLGDVQRMADRVGIIDEGRLLVDCAVDELLGSTKRIRAVLTDGSTPSRPPDGTIWQRTEKREWLVTVKDFTDGTAEQVRGTDGVENVEVIDLSLEDIFKDYIRGRRASA